MDLFIETLTGTAFELRVSPFETIMSVKAKIQRLEGELKRLYTLESRGKEILIIWSNKINQIGISVIAFAIESKL